MKKSIFTLFFILLVVFSCGCSQKISLPEKLYEKNSIRLIREIETDGQIKMTYTFGINTENFKSKGLSDNAQKVYKFYFASYINALTKQYKDKETKGVEVSSCIYFSDIDAFGFSINFKNQAVQSDFYKSQNDSSSGFILKRHFFTNEYLLETDFPISSQATAQNFLAPTKLALQETAKECEISKDVLEKCKDCLNDTIFIYDFSSNSTQVKSHTTYFDGEKQHNFFAKTLNEIGEPIEFYYITPNRPTWYICALAFVLIGVFTSLLVLKRKKTRHF